MQEELKMAYDEQLAARISELIHERPGVVERKMFGGMGWTIGGNMACGVMREDHLVVRIAPEETEAALREPHVHEFGRPGSKPMKGFVMIEPAALADDAELARWVECGAQRASEMKPK
jgi:TfoX/Sxy family transcriptional regulator of competence genes